MGILFLPKCHPLWGFKSKNSNLGWRLCDASGLKGIFAHIVFHFPIFKSAHLQICISFLNPLSPFPMHRDLRESSHTLWFIFKFSNQHIFKFEFHFYFPTPVHIHSHIHFELYRILWNTCCTSSSSSSFSMSSAIFSSCSSVTSTVVVGSRTRSALVTSIPFSSRALLIWPKSSNDV